MLPGLHLVHPETERGIVAHGDERGFVAPVLEQLARAGRPTVEGRAIVRTQAREHRQVVGPLEHVHGVQLDEPDVLEYAPEVPDIDPPVRARRGEPLSR